MGWIMVGQVKSGVLRAREITLPIPLHCFRRRVRRNWWRSIRDLLAWHIDRYSTISGVRMRGNLSAIDLAAVTPHFLRILHNCNENNKVETKDAVGPQLTHFR